MKRGVLLDTGPLVASLNKRDRFHDWAKMELADIEPPLKTCEAVIAESCFLLRKYPAGPAAIMELIERKVIEISFSAKDHATSLKKLLGKYSNVPISFADACLVRMTELYDSSAVMTLDSDFKIYRRHGRKVIDTLFPKDF